MYLLNFTAVLFVWSKKSIYHNLIHAHNLITLGICKIYKTAPQKVFFKQKIIIYDSLQLQAGREIELIAIRQNNAFSSTDKLSSVLKTIKKQKLRILFKIFLCWWIDDKGGNFWCPLLMEEVRMDRRASHSPLWVDNQANASLRVPDYVSCFQSSRLTLYGNWFTLPTPPNSILLDFTSNILWSFKSV